MLAQSSAIDQCLCTMTYRNVRTDVAMPHVTLPLQCFLALGELQLHPSLLCDVVHKHQHRRSACDGVLQQHMMRTSCSCGQSFYIVYPYMSYNSMRAAAPAMIPGPVRQGKLPRAATVYMQRLPT